MSKTNSVVPQLAISHVDRDRRFFWRFRATSRVTTESSRHPTTSNAATRILASRTRLARLTESLTAMRKPTNTTAQFEMQMVEVRQSAKSLTKAIESAINEIFSHRHRIRDGWFATSRIFWEIDCIVALRQELPGSLQGSSGSLSPAPDERNDKQKVYLEFEDEGTSWKLQDPAALEGLLGLWIWSLKSGQTTTASHFDVPALIAGQVPRKRIIATGPYIPEALAKWFNNENIGLPEKSSQVGLPDRAATGTISPPEYGDPYRPVPYGRKVDAQVRFFGWYGVDGEVAREKKNEVSAWTIETESDLLTLCSQEIFGSFLSGILHVLDDIGTVDIQETQEPFLVERTLISQMMELFTKTGLGSKDDALLCVLPPIITPLHRKRLSLAACLGDAAAVNEVLEANGVDLGTTNDMDDDNETALFLAVRNRHVTIVEALLQKCKLNADVRDRRGRTPLSWAAEAGDIKLVAVLLQHESDPDAQDNVGTPLSWAAKNGHETVVKLMFEAMQADPETAAKDRRTALSWAAKLGYYEIVKLLLDTGKVVPDAEDREGQTPLSLAAQNGFGDVVKLLLDTGKVFSDAEDRRGRTPLSWAAQSGHQEVIRILLTTGRAEPNARDISGRRPILWAANGGHKDALSSLLFETAGKVSVETRDNDGRTPLLWAAECGHTNAVIFLLHEGKAKLDIKDLSGRTPLSWAAQNGYEEIVELLLRKRETTGEVNPDAKDNNGRTPLSRAATNGHAAVVEQLLRYHADEVNPDAEDNDGCTPLSWAARHGREEVIRLLLGDNRVAVNATDEKGRTALIWATEYASEIAVKTLLENSEIDVNAKDVEGKTALMLAVRGSSEGIVTALLKMNGINVNAKDRSGRTALLWAAQRGSENGVRALLNRKEIDIDAEDDGGKTAHDWAEEILRGVAKREHDYSVNLRGVEGDGGLPRSSAETEGTKVQTEQEFRMQLLTLEQQDRNRFEARHEAIVSLLRNARQAESSAKEE
ncbi:hypothetical protein LLEC1_05057 [Akanthomyces lecanii]|uniref:Uncharacterized protein n=1 Tax=Cordyceps confragosa TaxID=2714763 RepID=A0A179I3Q1_CORDF|nr:hypothetical protein LLEC1_05057 [Akanthomyces lecanii]